MAALTGLFRRGTTYYLRVMLPLQHPLRHRYKNASAVTSLGCSGHREAVLKGTIKRAEILAGLLVQCGPSSTALTAVPQLTHIEALPIAVSKFTLQNVYSRWCASKKRSADSESACLRAVCLCEEYLGPVDVTKLTRAQGDAFRAWLLTKGTTSKTSKDRFTWVKTLLKYATQDLEVISRSPWAGLDIAHKTTARRRPWLPDELSLLFSQPLFTCYELPTEWRAGRAAAYWVPLIGLFTGARISELAQLRPQDISSSGPIPQLCITDAGEGQQVKTSASVRNIPIHSELIRLGFLEYVEAMRLGGESSLWPHLKLRNGRPGGFISDWFGKFRKGAGLTEQYPDFHSFRHSVRTLLSRAGVDHKVQDCITGHETGGSTGTRVYQHTDEQELLVAVETLAYPSLVLPRVYMKQIVSI